ncbi:choice-of-anchor J domain-containing protein [uncultured Winogradskyella sp.]|uniref:T9SS-dependent choice-of-anchor J family protein n=1 Tax=uncultured Winogradskyella sp. TaxID=395353 RepID=UPI00261EBD68|nr:choice-of-anchor J domain-containing protein [uncultured Winogradskyella sp.]
MKKITLLLLTLCISLVSYAQFPESFDGGPNIPAGWAVFDNGIGTTWSWTVNDTDDYVSVRWSEVLPAGQIAEDWIVTPQIAITTMNNLLTFDMTDFNAPDFGSEVKVRVSTDPTQTNIAGFTDIVFTIDELDTNGGAFQPWSVDLSAYVGSSIYVAFVMENNDGDAWGLDNVDFVEIPSCADPTSFAIGPNGITLTSVDVAWTDPNGAGTVFDIEYGELGFTLGTGTIVNDIAATNYDITGLMPDTNYELYITANCSGGNGDSAQVGPVGFLTAFDCTNYTIPSTEVFDNNNAFVNCYATEDADGDGLSWITQQDLDLDGDMIPETFATNANGDPATVMKDDWMFSPPLALVGGTTYEVTTRYNVFSGTPNASLEAFIVDATSSTATQLATLFSNTGIVTQGDFATLETMAYEEVNTFSVSNSGDYHIAYRSFGAGDSGFVLMFDSNIDVSLSVADFESNVFTHNYNKISKTLNLDSSDMAMTNIEIYSILGQAVISKPLSSTSESINVSSLNDGVYLAKVNIDGYSKTIRFVKN